MRSRFVKVSLLLRLGALAVSLLSEFERLGCVFERLPGMLLAAHVIAFCVVHCGGAMSMRGLVMELSGSLV